MLLHKARKFTFCIDCTPIDNTSEFLTVYVFKLALRNQAKLLIEGQLYCLAPRGWCSFII